MYICREGEEEEEKKQNSILMSFGGFLENNISTSSGGGGARIVADISYTNNDNNGNMPTTATLAHPRLLSSTHPLSKSMFNSTGLSLALVYHSSLSLSLSRTGTVCVLFIALEFTDDDLIYQGL